MKVLPNAFFCIAGALLGGIMGGCAPTAPPTLKRIDAPVEKPVAKRFNILDSARIKIEVSVSQQKMVVLYKGEIIHVYDVSTSRRGVGNRMGSYQTPLGRHRIYRKIGDGEAIGQVFKWATPQDYLVPIRNSPYAPKRPRYIVTRVLWLEGLEDGINKGAGIDSRERHIYIHGTNQEGMIGAPDSFGCILMKNKDVIELFDLASEGTEVTISW